MGEQVETMSAADAMAAKEARTTAETEQTAPETEVDTSAPAEEAAGDVAEPEGVETPAEDGDTEEPGDIGPPEVDLFRTEDESEELPRDKDGYYQETGIPEVDAIVADLKESGIASKRADRIFAEAMASLDVEKLNMKELTKAVGKDKAEVIKMRAQLFFLNEKQVRQDMIHSIDKAADGKWGEVTTWARQNLDRDVRDNYRAMIASGGLQRDLAVADLISKSGVLATEAQADPLITPDQGRSMADSTYLSKEDFQKETRKLPRQGGILTTPEAIKKQEILDARRLKSIKMEQDGLV